MSVIPDRGTSRLAARYIALLATLALLVFGATLFNHLPHEPARGMPLPWLAAIVLVACVLAQHFPLHLSYQTKVDMDTAVLVAGIFLLDPLTIMVIAALSVILHEVITRRGLLDGIFNASQTMLAVGVAAALYRGLHDLGGPPVAPGLGTLAAMIASVVALHATNTLAVATMSSLHIGANPVKSWLAGLRLDAPEQAALAIFGGIAAIIAFNHSWLLPAFMVPVALVHRSLRRSIDLRNATRVAVEELAVIVDRRDPDKIGHSERVAELVHRLGNRFELSARDLEIVTAAARVHDVGKVSLDPRMTAKPGPLSEADWTELRRHPIVGAELLERFPTYTVGARAVRHHHERWDGAGYPDGLAGEAIPLGARLIAVADAFDAMTSRRPYRPELTEAAARAELEQGAGVQWDPTVVAAFVAMLQEEREVAALRPRTGREMVARPTSAR